MEGNILILKRKSVLFLLTLALAGSFFVLYFTNNPSQKTTLAIAGSHTVDLKNQWESGTQNNILATVNDEIEINIKDKTGLTYSGMTATSDIRPETAGPICIGGESPADNCTNTNWFVDYVEEGNGHWWQLDMLETKKAITSVSIANDFCWIFNNTIVVSYSTDGTNFSNATTTNTGDETCHQFDFATAFDARYIRITFSGSPIPPGTNASAMIWSFQVFQGSRTAIHTSASTQFDAGAHDTVSWTTFTPSATIRPNTSMSFKFRTSADATTWSAWSTSAPYAASIDLSGLTQQRYLQVESTLVNTDGFSTPILDSYTANYDYTDPPEETCSDNVQNQGETGVDCGGPCEACPVPETCDDGILNQDETDTDCGGVCEACPVPETCEDGIQNQDETDIDCGGVCEACPVPETCSDGLLNQNETDVDCGGVCPACPMPPTCTDGIQNQGETGVDCGGPCTACIIPGTCSDGIKNQNEDKTDCGGVCSACPIDPTCSDGIKNQNETGMDCGGVCGECPKECKLQECSSQAVTDLGTCHNSGKSYETCVNEYCTAIRSCYRDCGYYGSVEEYLKLVQPNGDESYKISENVPVKWYFTAADKRTKVMRSDISLTMSLSLDGGATYAPLKLLVPSGRANSPLVKIESDTTQLDVGTYQIDTANQSYSYSWIPANPSFITDQARIKLEPHLPSCVIKLTGDSSDNDFRIWADKSYLYVKLVPSLLEANPGDERSVKAFAYLSSGEDVTDKTIFSFSLSKAATRLSASGNTLSLKIGTDTGHYDRAILVRGTYGTLSGEAYGNIKITEPASPPPEECGYICEFIGIVKSLTKASPSTVNLMTLFALLVGLANGLINSVMIGKDLIAPFLKGKNKKNSHSLVYNSLTGQPIPGVKIMLINKQLGNLAALTVSDREGRYSLDLSPNKQYEIQVDKTGFSLLKNRSSSMDSAGLPYADNYLGGEFTAGDDQLIFVKNIPLLEIDPELEIKRLLAKSKINNIIFAINLPLLVSGSIIAVVILYNFPILFNYLVVCLYFLTLVLYLIRSFTLEGKGNGVVTNASKHNEVVDLALIRAIRASDNRLEHTVLSDHEGRYSLAVPKGIYKVFAVKSGLEQTREVPLVVRSSFRPSTNTIEMHERQMPESQPEPNITQSLEAESAAIPAAMPSIANNPQPLTPASQPIDSSYCPTATTPSEIIERFEGNQGSQI